MSSNVEKNETADTTAVAATRPDDYFDDDDDDTYMKDSEEPPTVPDGHELIVEGKARMIYPKSKNIVFYNPVQVQNRDLSVLMLSMYAERRMKALNLKRTKKQWIAEATSKQQQQQNKDQAKKEGDNEQPNKKRKNKSFIKLPKDVLDDIETRLKDYETSTDWSKKFTDSVASSSGTDVNEIRGMRVLDALAASGLRSIRYWTEVPGIHEMVINDMDIAAVDQAKANIKFNGLDKKLIDTAKSKTIENNDQQHGGGIRIICGDATHEMYLSRRVPGLQIPYPTPTQNEQREQYDVIDLDPYGSAAPFLDAAIQSVANGGLLAITCTDMAALGGSHPETCYGRYAAMPIPRAKYLQEMALRILLHTIATTAARHGRTMKPILSVGMAFYVRVFVEIYDDRAGVNDLSLQIGTVYQSTQCASFHVVPHGQFRDGSTTVYQPIRAPKFPQCEETGGPFKTGGPLWLGPLHDMDVAEEALSRLDQSLLLPFDTDHSGKQPKRTSTKNGHGRDSSNAREVDPKLFSLTHLKSRKALHGLLTSVSEELNDVPLFYSLPDLCHTVHCRSPPLQKVRAAIVNAGYRVSCYHKDPQALKTDAPNHVVWDIIRAWCQIHPPLSSKQNKKRMKLMANETSTDDKNNDHKNKDGDNAAAKDSNNTSETSDVPRTADKRNPGEKILSTPPSIEVDFTIPKEVAKMRHKNKNAQRFPQNPQPHWGPKPRASGYNYGRKRKNDEQE